MGPVRLFFFADSANLVLLSWGIYAIKQKPAAMKTRFVSRRMAAFVYSKLFTGKHIHLNQTSPIASIELDFYFNLLFYLGALI